MKRKTTKEKFIEKKLKWFKKELKEKIKLKEDFVQEYEELFDDWIEEKFYSQLGMRY